MTDTQTWGRTVDSVVASLETRATLGPAMIFGYIAARDAVPAPAGHEGSV